MDALILVDLQNDFFPGGALPVSTAPETLPALARLLKQHFDLIVATKDWHPHNHASFASMHNKKPGEIIELQGQPQILWPDHCVQGQYGSEFHSGWDTSLVQQIFYKGTDPDIDSYSAFFDNNHIKSTGLPEFLRAHKVDTLYIAGLATDYCVKYSVLDALKLHYKTFVIVDACRGVNLQSDDSDKALHEMQQTGAILISAEEVENIRGSGI